MRNFVRREYKRHSQNSPFISENSFDGMKINECSKQNTSETPAQPLNMVHFSMDILFWVQENYRANETHHGIEQQITERSEPSNRKWLRKQAYGCRLERIFVSTWRQRWRHCRVCTQWAFCLGRLLQSMSCLNRRAWAERSAIINIISNESNKIRWKIITW